MLKKKKDLSVRNKVSNTNIKKVNDFIKSFDYETKPYTRNTSISVGGLEITISEKYYF